MTYHDIPIPFNTALACKLRGVLPAMLVQHILYNSVKGYDSKYPHPSNVSYLVPLKTTDIKDRFPRTDIRTALKHLKTLEQQEIIHKFPEGYAINVEHPYIKETYFGDRHYNYITRNKLPHNHQEPLMYQPRLDYADKFGINNAVIFDRLFYAFSGRLKGFFPQFDIMAQDAVIRLSKKDLKFLFPFFGNAEKRMRQAIIKTGHIIFHGKNKYSLSVEKIACDSHYYGAAASFLKNKGRGLQKNAEAKFQRTKHTGNTQDLMPTYNTTVSEYVTTAASINFLSITIKSLGSNYTNAHITPNNASVEPEIRVLYKMNNTSSRKKLGSNYTKKTPGKKQITEHLGSNYTENSMDAQSGSNYTNALTAFTNTSVDIKHNDMVCKGIKQGYTDGIAAQTLQAVSTTSCSAIKSIPRSKSTKCSANPYGDRCVHLQNGVKLHQNSVKLHQNGVKLHYPTYIIRDKREIRQIADFQGLKSARKNGEKISITRADYRLIVLQTINGSTSPPCVGLVKLKKKIKNRFINLKKELEEIRKKKTFRTETLLSKNIFKSGYKASGAANAFGPRNLMPPAELGHFIEGDTLCWPESLVREAANVFKDELMGLVRTPKDSSRKTKILTVLENLQAPLRWYVYFLCAAAKITQQEDTSVIDLCEKFLLGKYSFGLKAQNKLSDSSLKHISADVLSSGTMGCYDVAPVFKWLGLPVTPGEAMYVLGPRFGCVDSIDKLITVSKMVSEINSGLV